jgi:hypothetical protein
MSHHDSQSCFSQRLNQPTSSAATADFFNKIGQKRRDRPSALVDQRPQYPESGRTGSAPSDDAKCHERTKCTAAKTFSITFGGVGECL